MPDFDLVTLAATLPWLTVWFAFSLAVVAVWFLNPVARRAGWVDRPNARKIHEGEVPLVGGFAMLFALITVQFTTHAEHRAPMGYWIGALLLFLVAVSDDRSPIRARYRFTVQLAAALAGVSLGGHVLPNLGDLFGTGLLTNVWLMMLVSILGTVAVINAVNFTDGADGLCGGLGLIGLWWFLIALAIADGASDASGQDVATYGASLIPLAAATMGALAGFLLFNMRAPWRKKAAIFMGDSGSTLIGFTLAWLAIHVTSANGSASISPVTCLWILAVPLADSASCIVRRILSGVTPMTADLKHLHHLVYRSGLTVGQSVLAIQAGAFLCGMIGVAGWWAGIADYWMFGAFVATLSAFVGVTNLMWRRIDGVRTIIGVRA